MTTTATSLVSSVSSKTLNSDMVLRQVYADLLEEEGRISEATWLRLPNVQVKSYAGKVSVKKLAVLPKTGQQLFGDGAVRTYADRKLIKAVRNATKYDCPSQTRIVVVDGFSAPTVSGRTGWWTGPNGDLVRFPNAYRRKFGRPQYNHATWLITVGAGWLIRKGLV